MKKVKQQKEVVSPTRDVMIRALNLARKQLNTYKEVCKNWKKEKHG